MKNQTDARPVEAERIAANKARVISEMEQGLEINDAAAAAGVHRTSIWRWMRGDAVFRAGVAEARGHIPLKGQHNRNTEKHPPTGPLEGDAGLEYMAGFLDGEGCFVWSAGHSTHHGAPMIQCSNTYPPILHMLQRRFGGRVHPEPRQDQEKHRKSWRWQATGLTARNALLILQDVMVEKAEQIRLLLAAWDTPPGPARLPLIAGVKAAKRPTFTGDEGKNDLPQQHLSGPGMRTALLLVNRRESPDVL